MKPVNEEVTIKPANFYLIYTDKTTESVHLVYLVEHACRSSAKRSV